MDMIGRPSKLNEELIEQMSAKLKTGLPVMYACDLFGITRMSFSNWMKQGEDDYSNDVVSLYADFFYAIKKAQAEFVDNSIQDIRSGRPGWQGAAWVLERTRQDFMPKQEITAGDDGKVTVVLGGKVKEIKRDDRTN